ncbi:MAG TPA: DUF5522 domain-containing protein [Verrucomicrobiae bacterium]|nr:DUF5522 domain-containing protein [Verrucomicrobiae bacterium]
MEETFSPEVEKAHREACERGSKFYTDPVSGYEIYTRRYLLERGFCCNQCCRHCPYGTPDSLGINTKAFDLNKHPRLPGI